MKCVINITPNWSAWFVKAGNFYLWSVSTQNGIHGRGILYQFWDKLKSYWNEDTSQIDANGCAECPDCHEKIKVGTAGIQNMHKTHHNSKNFQNTIAKKQQEKKMTQEWNLWWVSMPQVGIHRIDCAAYPLDTKFASSRFLDNYRSRAPMFKSIHRCLVPLFAYLPMVTLRSIPFSPFYYILPLFIILYTYSFSYELLSVVTNVPDWE